MRKTKSQTSALLIVIVLIIFSAMAVFLLTVSQTQEFEEYNNIYINNLLITVLRTDTGYTDSNCKFVSDLLACAYFSPEYRCDNNGPKCGEEAEIVLNNYMSAFGNIRKNIKYLFVVKPQGFRSDTQIKIGDSSLDCDPTCRFERFAASETIHRGSYILKAVLYMARK